MRNWGRGAFLGFGGVRGLELGFLRAVSMDSNVL